MSVVIRGMEMPKSCYECLFRVGAWCALIEDWRKAYNTPPNGERLEDCPLVELPPHGRLIDADALTEMCREMQSIDWNKKAFPYSWEHAYEEFENDIDEAPTIIGAEGASG